ncbi:cell division protein ZapC [Aestuariibacter halophilus]|uniref:Cell division protein ZapC n=1 Tax=Fluctibacter halophilus TaxID=226011 RepID=A0ABS8G516_9ALTE|nr:cell division protein ZapC domain-containing protein [Aestuariibacter halophilus]MCC2615677.1 cell division protein ZapC [Aestuariibacter halophilus]
MTPRSDWYWYQHTTTQRIALSLDEEQCFVSAVGAKQVCKPLSGQLPFSIEDHAHYARLTDALTQLGKFNDLQVAQAALNGCAALAFHKPISHKSWYVAARQQHSQPPNDDVVQLIGQSGPVAALVLERDQSSALCMLLEGQIDLANGKTLVPFSIIRVLQDRLHSLTVRRPSALYARSA